MTDLAMTNKGPGNEALISRLAGEVAPVARHGLARRLAAGLGPGLLTSVLLVLLVLGPRADLGAAVLHASFWIKLAYCASLALLGSLAVARLARPDALSLGWLAWLALPVLLLAGLGGLQLADAAPGQRPLLWLGSSWRVCPLLVLALALPVLGGLLLGLRWLAPTRLVATGAAAGLASGGWAAVLYGFHCPEVSAPFVLLWYSLGMALACGLGAALGPGLLRW